MNSQGPPNLIVSIYEPRWDGDTPLCSNECRSLEGNRCRHLDAEPGRICEPAVQDITTQLRAYQSQDQARCNLCGVHPTQESKAKEECRVCGKGDGR